MNTCPTFLSRRQVSDAPKLRHMAISNPLGPWREPNSWHFSIYSVGRCRTWHAKVSGSLIR